MLASVFSRLSAGRVAPGFVKGGLTRCVLRQSLQQNVRALASEAIPTIPKPPRKPRTVKPKTATATTKKAAAPKKVVKKKAAAPKKVKKVVKPKPWEARGADGKLLPLPSATKPKKTSSFLLYAQTRMPDLKTDPSMQRPNDKVDVTKILSAIGSEWRAMSDADKRPFEDQAQEAKAVFESKMAEWRNSLTAEDIRRQNAYLRDQARKGKKIIVGRLRDPAKPKAPTGRLILFLSDFRTQHGDGKLVDVARAGGAEWKSMSPEQKKPYVDKADESKAAYATAMKEYQANTS